MSEVMAKKQLESSEIQTGACRFCGQIYQFETDGAASEEQLDKWAEEKCDCLEARIANNKTRRCLEAEEALKQILGDKYEEYEEAAGIVVLGAELILQDKATKVMVDTGEGTKLSISINAKGVVKVEVNAANKRSMEV